MKKLSRLVLLIVGMTASAAMAQKADSVIVIYDNQKTIIPLPAFGSQTSVSYADSNKVVEIGVWLRKPGETSPFPQFSSNNLTAAKSENKSKWFSQIEVGYALAIPDHNSSPSINELGNFNGYKLGLSIRDRERYINNNIAFVSGFKVGYEQLFRSVPTPEGNWASPVYRNSFLQFLFPVGIRYHFTAFNLPANAIAGANLNYSYSFVTTKNNSNSNGKTTEYDNAFIFIQPYLGLEIGKLGLIMAIEKNLFPNKITSTYNPLKSTYTFSLTYRLF